MTKPQRPICCALLQSPERAFAVECCISHCLSFGWTTYMRMQIHALAPCPELGGMFY